MFYYIHANRCNLRHANGCNLRCRVFLLLVFAQTKTDAECCNLCCNLCCRCATDSCQGIPFSNVPCMVIYVCVCVCLCAYVCIYVCMYVCMYVSYIYTINLLGHWFLRLCVRMRLMRAWCLLSGCRLLSVVFWYVCVYREGGREREWVSEARESGTR